jgi:hypothetical protein
MESESCFVPRNSFPPLGLGNLAFAAFLLITDKKKLNYINEAIYNSHFNNLVNVEPRPIIYLSLDHSGACSITGAATIIHLAPLKMCFFDIVERVECEFYEIERWPI